MTVVQARLLTGARFCPQVNVPVQVPGQPPMSVALLGLQRSDMRLLHVAAKLGPVISRMAREHASSQVGSSICASRAWIDTLTHVEPSGCHDNCTVLNVYSTVSSQVALYTSLRSSAPR